MAKSTLTMTNEQRDMLMARYADTRTQVLAEELGISYRQVCRWAAQLKLKKSKDFKSEMSTLAALRYEQKRKATTVRKHTVLNEEKIAYMRQYFPTTPNAILANALGVNDRTVRRWASDMGLKKEHEAMELHRISRMTRTPEEWFQTVATIQELYPDGRDKEIMEKTGYSRYYIMTIAKKYGVTRSAGYRRRKRKKKHGAELVEAVKEYFPTHTDKECADRFGLKKTTVQYLARLHGWNKSEEHVRRMYGHNITAAQEYNRKTKNNKAL